MVCRIEKKWLPRGERPTGNNDDREASGQFLRSDGMRQRQTASYLAAGRGGYAHGFFQACTPGTGRARQTLAKNEGNDCCQRCIAGAHRVFDRARRVGDRYAYLERVACMYRGTFATMGEQYRPRTQRKQILPGATSWDSFPP